MQTLFCTSVVSSPLTSSTLSVHTVGRSRALVSQCAKLYMILALSSTAVGAAGAAAAAELALAQPVLIWSLGTPTRLSVCSDAHTDICFLSSAQESLTTHFEVLLTPKTTAKTYTSASLTFSCANSIPPTDTGFHFGATHVFTSL